MNATLNPMLLNDIDTITKINAIPSILNIICRTTGMRFSAVARVTDEKWITCLAHDEIDFGLNTGDELALETTLCNEVRQHTKPIIIDKVKEDAIYANHHTPQQYGFQSYISYPIYRKNGEFFGTLCAIDWEPAKLDNDLIRDMFKLYADLISFHLSTSEEIHQLNKKLQEEKHISELRETFIAILGHDLRNPVGTTRMCADILLNTDLSEMQKRQVHTIKSTSYRMQGLIDNLLDFAKGHLGGGIRLEYSKSKSQLMEVLRQVTNEITIIDDTRVINTTINLDDSPACDVNRIGQLYGNLLSNAIKHGTSDYPVTTEIKTCNGIFSIKVSNAGNKIPKDKKLNLFKPFFSTNTSNNKSGLGLGLYISSEIAKAHEGKIEVNSTNKLTSFEFVMPLNKMHHLA